MTPLPMTPLHTAPLHEDFGVEIRDVDLSTVTAGPAFDAIRMAFETRSLLLFRDQRLDDAAILRLGELFGPIENRTDGPVHVSHVSNVLPDGSISLPDALHTKNLKANMLWHTDSTFLPVPALANIITAQRVPDTGGATELVSTRAGFRRLPAKMQDFARGAMVRHSLGHSRRKIDSDLTKLEAVAKWPAQTWRAVWPNPVTGEEALYIASHAFAIEGMADADAQAWIDDVVARMTAPERVYSHAWRPGDVLIWDERATLHRGMPWPYDQARVLASICVSATEADGLAAIRPH